MAIRDKDGKVYKLRGPNPLMNDQNLDWDKSKLKLHNFSWNSECVKDPISPEARFQKEHPKVNIAEELGLKPNGDWIPPFEFVNELKATRPTTIAEEIPEDFPVIEEEPVVEEPEEIQIPLPKSEQPKPESPKEFNVSSQVARIFHERGMEFHCAPVYQVSMRDDLYGTEYKMNRYGDKFIFDGVVVEENDLELIYWCVKEMTKGSVVMPKSRESRWWRIEQIEPKTGGFLVKALPSDVNPDFS